MYLLFQLKSHAYMYESTPQHIIDEESAPGPVAQWMDSSSDDSSSSSSSDSDASSGSNTTAKRIRRVMRGGRRRRKSSFGSKDTADIMEASRTPSFGNSSTTPGDHFTDEPTFGHRLGAIDAADDGDDDDPRRSRKSSISNHALTKKERRKEKERKRKEKKQRKKARRNTNSETITEGIAESAADNGIFSEKTQEVDAPRRVDFAVAAVEPGTESQTDTSQRRRFNIASIRPAIPKTLSQNVFNTPVPSNTTASTGPIPRVRYGIRRTNSLPDRLNETNTPTASNLRIQPTRVTSLAIAANNSKSPSDEDEENISRTTAVVLLLVSTGLVAVCAEFMVDSINAVVSGNSALSETFIGLILLPIVGNAAEHVTAVTVASKNKMDLAIGVAVGSSIQIGLSPSPFTNHHRPTKRGKEEKRKRLD